jgi:hypothetical protein
MKLLLRGENQNPDVGHVGVYAKLAGVRCDAVLLEQRDVAALLHALQSNEHDKEQAVIDVLEDWLCRFVP